MDERFYLALFLAVLAEALFLGVVICVAVHRSRKKTVERTSEKLRKLSEINARYHFHTDIQKTVQLRHTASSKAQLEKYQLVQLLNYAILYDIDFVNTLNAVSENRKMYVRYIDETEKVRLPVTPEYVAWQFHVRYGSYKKIEAALFEKRKLKPILDFSVLCYASYTSPKGRSSYQKSEVYTAADVLAQQETLRKNMEYEASEERRKQIERAKMTDKLRYTVMKRDGFRCKLCGRSAEDGVKLHIDHIMPVSKGGRTTLDNLRTLCEQCNMGKSDEIE